MTDNKTKIQMFFEKNAHEYSTENYNIRNNKLMIIRLNTIINLVKKYLPNKNINILDLGCGSGEIALSLAELNYKGDALDYSPGMIKICKKKLSNYKWNVFLRNAENTNLPNQSYDLIIASGLIEYYPEDKILLNEINRLLKKNGILIINVTNKYGYSTCLNSISFYFKQNFFYKFLKTKIFKLNYGVVDFKSRKHCINKFKKELNDCSFSIIHEKYIGFTLLPSPFLTLFNFITYKIDIKLEKLSNSFLRYLGASCIVLCKKN